MSKNGHQPLLDLLRIFDILQFPNLWGFKRNVLRAGLLPSSGFEFAQLSVYLELLTKHHPLIEIHFLHYFEFVLEKTALDGGQIVFFAEMSKYCFY